MRSIDSRRVVGVHRRRAQPGGERVAAGRRLAARRGGDVAAAGRRRLLGPVGRAGRAVAGLDLHQLLRVALRELGALALVLGRGRRVRRAHALTLASARALEAARLAV